jgi:hypothetical protein
MKHFEDHLLCVSKSAIDDQLELLVKVGDDTRAAFKDTFSDYDGEEITVLGVVRGATLDRLFKQTENTFAPQEKTQCEEIYAAYPRKIGKPASMLAIRKALKKIDHAKLLEAVRAYAAAVEAWPAEDKQFVPYPQKFFNECRFNDDPLMWMRGNNAVVIDHSKGF